MTKEDIQKTFSSFIAWLKSTRDNINVEVIECNHAKYEHGVRVLEAENGYMLALGYGASQAEAMEDALEDAIIDYDLPEVNMCKSVEELGVKLAVMGF